MPKSPPLPDWKAQAKVRSGEWTQEQADKNFREREALLAKQGKVAVRDDASALQKWIISNPRFARRKVDLGKINDPEGNSYLKQALKEFGTNWSPNEPGGWVVSNESSTQSNEKRIKNLEEIKGMLEDDGNVPPQAKSMLNSVINTLIVGVKAQQAFEDMVSSDDPDKTPFDDFEKQVVDSQKNEYDTPAHKEVLTLIRSYKTRNWLDELNQAGAILDKDVGSYSGYSSSGEYSDSESEQEIRRHTRK